MSFHAWTVFALFWVVFVTTPGPNAVNCISNGMGHGFGRALWGVLAILTQASLFLTLSALGVTALIAASPGLYQALRLLGAGVLIWLGIRGWLNAKRPLRAGGTSGGSIYGRAFMIATINAKSLAGYLAAFTQFVQPDVPLWHQMAAIYPTALTITAASYCCYTAIGALMGRAAMGAVLNVWFRRVMAVAFVLYGIALGTTGGQHVRP
ncbi:amino acid transporter LysE [Defluviimonas sp. 20V17]|uniref:Homoserine/homoserine lactone efflux protein n=1 Tax=Allgaiera indica TaxID=765699 RepID=A0AAN4UPA3_9RHOB|nr:LysE family translocator [Allgaiera indica]KDB03748.1 amino acid transporter LysE [Defluviimonas sp. 20V17]GHD99901.1 homoserine/homoserine lactone efflux protein [Allgaiera indica]SDW41026.1 Threonine/homoserine/homoserine lactone efflux protein [Allgaiera indica]